jgi:hypothetical protein
VKITKELFSALIFVKFSSAGVIGLVLELPDQKTRAVLVLITLTQRFPEHARKVVGEMTMRT